MYNGCMQRKNETLNYYESHAQGFSQGTQSLQFTEIQDLFLEKLSPNSFILDFGCGSGRDARYFLNRGYRVEAVDGSKEMCSIAQKLLGQPVKNVCFEEIEEHEKYDAIWACASILHVPKVELGGLFGKLNEALVSDGILYASFKYSEFEGMRNGRYFTDFTCDSFSEFLKQIPGWQIEESWISRDVRPGRDEEKWLNLILRKR